MRTVGAAARGDPAESAGEGVEAVGVEDQRRLDRGDDLAGQLDRAGVAAEAGAEDPGGGALEASAAPPSREPGARQPSPPGQPTDITSGWPASKTGSRSAGTATVA